MWFPFKKHTHRPTWGNLIFHIILPGFITFYLVYTEKAFIDRFTEDMGILLYGEVFFIGIHSVLTYFFLPAIWFFDLMLFTRIAFPGAHIHHDLFNVLASIMYIIIAFMMFIRFFY